MNKFLKIKIADQAYHMIENPLHDPTLVEILINRHAFKLDNSHITQEDLLAASIINQYNYLLSSEISTKEAIRRLRILRNERENFINEHSRKNQKD